MNTKNYEYLKSIKIGTGEKRDYNKGDSVLDFIMKQAILNPSKFAVLDEKFSLTYDELFSKAASVANQLGKHGAVRKSKIAILMEPNCQLLIIIIATFMVGACYIPIDPNYPDERIDYILENSNPALLVTNMVSTTQSNIPILVTSEINFNESALVKKMMFTTHGDDPAYIIYTSGSTGKPKGIVVPHKAINNHMLWMCNAFGLSDKDRILLKTPLTFDPSVWEMFLGLYLGASLVIAKSGSHANPDKLLDYITNHDITVLQLVPVVLQKFLSSKRLQACSSLRYLFVGGESLPHITKELFFKSSINCELINLYGPAEATIDVTYHYVRNTENELSHNFIGRPIDNTTLYILDEQLQLCNIGTTGELYITGDCLAIGYLNNAELNEKNFIDNPFYDGVKMYKTGDLAKWVKINSGHVIEYVGRKDKQIKLNGVRIETESLRNTILNIDHIYDCIIEKKYIDEHQYSILVCYIIPEDGFSVDINQVKTILEKNFPSYMLPKKYCCIDHPNLSPNGKIELKNTTESGLTEIDAANVFKNDSMMHQLRNIWKSVLQTEVPNEKCNFYDIGGDSITSYILADEISKAFEIHVKPEDIMQYENICSQSQYIKKLKHIGLSKSRDVNPIVVLNSKAPRSIFLIHPIGGTIFWYTHLSKLLDEKLQIYGIQDPGIIIGKPLFCSINEMAEYYAEKIQKQQPSGPYLLGGASFGATVAVEIARTLIKRGQEVASVSIFDGWAIYPRDLSNRDYFHKSMLSQQKDWLNKFNKNILDVSLFDHLFEIQIHRLNMLFKYKMANIDFHLDLFKAEEIMPIFQSIDEPFNHWKKYADNIKKYIIPGNHETMFIKENVIKIANILCGSNAVTNQVIDTVY